MKPTLEWLVDSFPWVEYRTRIDLLGQPENDSRVVQAQKAMAGHPLVQARLRELAEWPGVVISSHKSASQPFHKLSFIADLGLTVNDPRVKAITKKVMEHQSPESVMQLPMKISSAYGGSGKEVWAWALCDAPLILYSLVKMGLENNRQVRSGMEYLKGLVRQNGWPCAVSPELGKFRGPGKKDDPCPFANLVMLKFLNQTRKGRESEEARLGAETLLSLWKQSKARHPYIFYMGNDFRKLKAPFIWYDILHVVEVLSQFPWLGKDARLGEMVKIIRSKADREGRFTPESEWKAWKGWDFCQKKEPSPWLTFLILRILKRFE